MIRVDRVGKRIHLKTGYTNDKQLFKARLEKCKAIRGASWAPTHTAWTYPLDLEVCRRLREVWGDELEIGPALWAWATGERKRETDTAKLVNVADIDVMSIIDLPRIKELAPTMWEAMENRPFQPVAAQYMALARQALNGDQPGVGKTIETLGALVELGLEEENGLAHVLVLAPKKSTRVVWEPEIWRWMGDYTNGMSTTVISGMSPAKAEEAIEEYMMMTDPGIHFLIANAEFVRIKRDTFCPAETCNGDEDWCPDKDKHINKSEVRKPLLFNIAWDAIIADETHKWLINTRGKKASQVGYGFTKLISANMESPVRFALTGTPLKGKKHNVFGTFNWLRPQMYTSKWRWIEDHFEVYDDGYGRVIGDMRDEELFYRRMDSIMIRRTKSELHKMNPAWMPPDKVYHDVVIPLEPEQKRIYKEMTDDAGATFGAGRLTAKGILAEMTRLRQFAQSAGELRGGTFYPTLPSNKFNWLLEFLEERGISARVGSQEWGYLSDDVSKVVVGSQFTKLLNMYAEELTTKGIRTYSITGATSEKDAERVVQNWADMYDPVRVCLINTMAGGVSITLDAADGLIVHDETWVPDEQEQLEDRVHRASRTDHQVDIWYPRSDETLEEQIMAANIDKAVNNHVALDAQRGLAFAREHLRAGKEAK